MKKNYLILLFISLIIFTFYPTSVTKAKGVNYNYSGTVKLPPGKVAPAGGIQFRITYSDDPYSFNVYYPVLIPQGKSSANFNIKFSTEPNKSCVIGCNITKGSGYLTQVYYNNSGTKTTFDKATKLKTNSKSINITLLPSTTILKGKISLPNGQKAPKGGFRPIIKAYGDDGSFLANEFNIAQGRNSTEFILYGDIKVNYRLSYSFFCDQKQYRNTKFIINPSEIASVVPKPAPNPQPVPTPHPSPSPLPPSNDNQQPGTKSFISGIISLPAGKVAPKGGITLFVYKQGTSYNNGPYYITEGKSATTYSINTDDNFPSQMEYRIQSGSGYFETGFYNPNGTVKDFRTATIVQLNSIGIDFTLIPSE